MLQIYSVYDSKAQGFLQPFFALADGVAIRMFQQACNDQEHNFSIWAEDYTLFQIGRWDEKTGTMHAAEMNINLGTANTFKEAPRTNGIENTNPPTQWETPQRSEKTA